MEWRPRERWAAAALIAVIGLVALYLGYRQYRAERSQAAGPPAADTLTVPPVKEEEAQGPPGLPKGEEAASDPQSEAASSPRAEDVIMVHVSGAVARPGVHRLTRGARVDDAVRAAEPLPEAVPDALNLAAVLRDGEKIYVPAAGDLVGGGSTLPPEARGAHHGPGTRSSSAEEGNSVVDINTADEAELESVPGIGPALAGRIVAYRRAHGPFERIEDLLAISGIGPAKLAEIRNHVVVH